MLRVHFVVSSNYPNISSLAHKSQERNNIIGWLWTWNQPRV